MPDPETSTDDPARDHPDAPALDLGRLRQDYRTGHLIETDLAGTWLAQFDAWFADALERPEIVEANAMQLATVDADGRPAVRTVLAKAVDEHGVVFYTHYDSAKGRALAANPYAAVVFSWLPLTRQIRLSGSVERVDPAETEAYFPTRPRGSRLGAWASPQSEVVADRDELDRRLADAARRFPEPGSVPVPPDWGGFRLRPDAVEFWQGRDNRMHDRLRFHATGGEWIVERLGP